MPYYLLFAAQYAHQKIYHEFCTVPRGPVWTLTIVVTFQMMACRAKLTPLFLFFLDAQTWLPW